MGLDLEQVMRWLGLCVIGAPVGLVALLGAIAVFKINAGERFIARSVLVCTGVALVSAVSLLVFVLYRGYTDVAIDIADWQVGESYHFVLRIDFDWLSSSFVILSLVLCAVVSSFSTRYLHREEGFERYFLFFSLFLLGMVTASLADTIETLFVGWEMVGLSSALLISFFHERQAPVRHGLWVWAVYRVADAALLLAAVVLHHQAGGGRFDLHLGLGPWPHGEVKITDTAVFIVGLLLVIAAAGKSGLVPFSGWLPRAMEGPTPSTAVFYGSLSVHLGAFLLLRMGPVLEASLTLSAIVVVLGLTTAVFATLSSSVQTDIKSALAYASLAQVGIIVTEIGLGLRWLPLVHIIGHACLRTVQFLRAPNLLRDYRKLENAVGGRLGHPVSGLLPSGVQAWLYRFGLERGWLDVLLWDWFARPFLQVCEGLDRLDRWWAAALSGPTKGDGS